MKAMRCRSPAHIVTLICMFIGTTTLSTATSASGKFVLMGDELSEPKRLRSVCVLHCAKKTKVSPSNKLEFLKQSGLHECKIR